MAPRANWKGYLRLSLVSCPIALYPASSLSEKVSFNRINRKTGNRLKQQNVDAETGDVVPREDIARGYEVAKGQYLVVEDEEIDAVQIESNRTIEIDQFCRAGRSMTGLSTRPTIWLPMARSDKTPLRSSVTRLPR
jgi:DNA end-binding protein Ku